MAFSHGGTWPVIPTVVLLIGGLLAAVPAASGGHVDAGDMLMMDRFRQWQGTHTRSYLSAEERLQRFEVYRSNVEYIDAANRRGDLTYELGENQFADLTGEEFVARYASSHDAGGHTDSVITSPPAAGGPPAAVITPAAEADGLWSSGGGDDSLEAPLPPSVDWRAKGAVTPVKNQGSQCCTYSSIILTFLELPRAVGIGPLPSA
uniref:Cathepsin propeptide inhibitor domain-containing protein n=1 Tax=Aegilops tauschii TaxID=37682 RepID=M8AHK7_AEGTA